LPAKAVLANYIVRIYRFEKNKPGILVGVAEEVGTRGKKAFTNLDELWGILSSSKSIKNDGLVKSRKPVTPAKPVPAGLKQGAGVQTSSLRKQGTD